MNGMQPLKSESAMRPTKPQYRASRDKVSCLTAADVPGNIPTLLHCPRRCENERTQRAESTTLSSFRLRTAASSQRGLFGSGFTSWQTEGGYTPVEGRTRVAPSPGSFLRFSDRLCQWWSHEHLPTESGGVPGVASPRRAHGAHEASFHRAWNRANPGAQRASAGDCGGRLFRGRLAHDGARLELHELEATSSKSRSTASSPTQSKSGRRSAALKSSRGLSRSTACSTTWSSSPAPSQAITKSSRASAAIAL